MKTLTGKTGARFTACCDSAAGSIMLQAVRRALLRTEAPKPLGRWQTDASNWALRADMANLDNGVCLRTLLPIGPQLHRKNEPELVPRRRLLQGGSVRVR